MSGYKSRKEKTRIPTDIKDRENQSPHHFTGRLKRATKKKSGGFTSLWYSSTIT